MLTEQASTNKEEILLSLRGIEGLTRSLQRMVEANNPSPDILPRICLIQAALNQVSLLLVEDHLRSCLGEAVEQGNDVKISEAMVTVKRYVKMPAYFLQDHTRS